MAGYVELPLFVAPESHPTCALPPRYSTKSRLRHCTSGVSGQRDNLQENVKKLYYIVQSTHRSSR
jgi:hypothetical protein